MRAIICLLTVLVIGHWVIDTPAGAQVDVPTGGLTAPITTDTDAQTDRELAQRLTGIFNEIDGLSGVEVSVREGVVTLSGSVETDDARTQAARLAERLSGVVAINNEIVREVRLDRSVDTLVGDVESTLTRIGQAWPVYLVALAVWLGLFALGWLLARQEWLWRRVVPNALVARLLQQVLTLGSFILGLLLALNLLGATALLGTLAGGVGLIGLAVGFAVRDTIENYIASILLSLRQPFRAEDHVRINEHEGVVVRLTSRATVLMTLDGNHLRIPNAQVFKGVILNFSRNPERRFDFLLGVDADDDPLAAMEVALEAMRGLDFLLDDPGPFAGIDKVGDSNIQLRFFAWVDQRHADFLKARSGAIRAAKAAIEAHGFTLPEPIYRLRFDTGDATLQVSSPSPRADTQTPPHPRRHGAAPPVDLDVRPEDTITEKVAEERAQDGEEDLLDQNRPVE